MSGATAAVPAIRNSRRSGLYTLLVAAMVALPPLSIDMVLPALPSIASSLHAPIGRAGLAISLFLVGFAISQLVLGPLSDRLGRRPSGSSRRRRRTESWRRCRTSPARPPPSSAS